MAKKAVVTKTVPLVGAGIGAAWNWVELEAVGKRAIRYYQRRSIGPTPKTGSKPTVSIRQIVRRLPWARRAQPQLPPPPPPPPRVD